MKQRLKRWIFRLLGKDPEAVVVTFCTGDAELCRRMAEEVRGLVPDRRHFVVTAENWPEMRRDLRKHYRIGLAPVMLTREPNALRRAAYRLAPRKILAYNSRLERHHLRLRSGVVPFLARRAARPHLPAPAVVAVAQARAFHDTPWLSRDRRPRLLAGAPSRGRALALLSLSAVARRRGAHLPSAARDGSRVRRGTVRLHRRRRRA